MARILKFVDQTYIRDVYEDTDLANEELLNKYIKRASTIVNQAISVEEWKNKEAFKLKDEYVLVQINGTDWTGGYKVDDKAIPANTIYQNTNSFADEAAVMVDLEAYALENEVDFATKWGIEMYQANAVMEATAIMTDFVNQIGYDFAEGSVSLSVGNASSFSQTGVNQDGTWISDARRLLQDAQLFLSVEIAEYEVDFLGGFEVDGNEEKNLYDDTKLQNAKQTIGGI